MRGELDELFHGLDARPHDVRGAVLDGPARLADRPHRRAADRLALRRGEHADHDPHGPGARSTCSATTASSCPACTRSGCRSPTAPRTCRGRATPTNKYIVHFPESARDLVLRLGLRRQRPARQEVLRAAHRLGDGPRRGLARRAHADPQAHLARGRGQARRRRVPVGLRQDQPRHAHPDAAGLEGRDGRRRHRLDEVRRRTAACTRSTPRPASSASRRAPARRRTRTRWPRRRELDLHQRRPDRRRRRLVGGHDRRAAGARHRLARPRLDAGLRRPGRAPERPLHRAGRAVPVDRARVGGPGRRADRRVPVRRPPRHVVPLVHEAFDWEHGVFLGVDHGLRDDRGRRRRGRRAAPRPVRDAAVLRLPHGRLLRALAGDRRARRARKLPRIFTSTGSARTRTGKFLWPGFGENSRVLAWIFRRSTTTPRRSRRRSGWCPPEARSTTEGLDLSAEDMAGAAAGRPRGWKAQLPQVRDHFAQFGDKLPDALRRQLGSLDSEAAT